MNFRICILHQFIPDLNIQHNNHILRMDTISHSYCHQWMTCNAISYMLLDHPLIRISRRQNVGLSHCTHVKDTLRIQNVILLIPFASNNPSNKMCKTNDYNLDGRATKLVQLKWTENSKLDNSLHYFLAENLKHEEIVWQHFSQIQSLPTFSVCFLTQTKCFKFYQSSTWNVLELDMISPYLDQVIRIFL